VTRNSASETAHNCRSAHLIGQANGVPIVAVLRDEHGNQQRGLPDPSGGTFDAAGDFDRLIPSDEGDCRLISYVDRYGDTMFNREQMADLLADLDQLRPNTEIEERGLARLRRLAEECRDGVHLYLWFIGG
jgi:hypothetical protein